MAISFEERYKKLNSAQKKAVDTIEGPLLVVAGPGSGKTEILSLRVAKILKEAQVLPSNILCLTFTESAALNMRERLSKLIGQEAYRVAIHTFHNFCVDIIQKYPEFFYKGAIFTPADPISQIAILEEIFNGLSHDHPFRSFHPEVGFVYLQDVSKAISNFKRSGITPDELDRILSNNKWSLAAVNELLMPVFEKKLSKGTQDEVRDVIKALRAFGVTASAKEDKSSLNDFFPSLPSAIASSLETALLKCEDSGKNEPLSKWKAKYIKSDDSGQKVFRDSIGLEKMHALATIYRMYREEMHKRLMFDFDDMILDTISAIETQPRLRFDLQEQYQYILVDEFQDTNNAQMRILNLIADAPVNEGRPNIMVVGDDDQAVYKFQGAELSNILNFRSSFTDVEMVSMTSNYRSTQDILDIATHIIRKGEQRLENLIPEMEKTLVSSNPEIKKGDIVHRTFDTSLHEYHFVSREIKRLIEAGKDARDIAIIARKHKQLEAIVPFLQGAEVPIRYEREQNVFQEPHIEQLIYMSRFVASLAQKDKAEADEYLPQILSFPFWQIPRKIIWQISRVAHKEGMTWLECMMNAEESGIFDSLPGVTREHVKRVVLLSEFLIELGVKALHEPLEKILDLMIGAHVQLVAESEDEDESAGGVAEGAGEKDPILAQEELAELGGPGGEFFSPFKQYYFSKERFEHARAEYLSFLSSLRVFVRALREYKGKAGTTETLLIQDLVDFVDIHVQNNISLNDESPFATARNAVNLLSAHKAKGLEFDTVFVLSCQDEVWAGRGMIKKISLPINLPVEPAGDNEDDQLRLFYVALTRAKHNLYMTSYKVKDDGSESMKLRFLLPPENPDEVLKKEALRKLYAPELDPAGVAIEVVPEEVAKAQTKHSPYTPETHELLTASWLLYHTPPFLDEEQELLRSLLEGYQLSVTHLNNFLNVAKGGPQLFLEQNLLRFPQAKTPSSAYGSAVHHALERLSVQLRAGGGLASKDEFIQWFIGYLALERLSKQDFKLYGEKGKKSLSAFYDARHTSFSPKDKIEVNFRDQGVIVQDGSSSLKVADAELGINAAHLTGKIDRVVDLGGGRIEVHDYKTGKARDEWKPKDEHEKIKLYEYERQLIFYNILIECSRDYSNMKVEKGMLDFVEPIAGGEIVSLELDINREKVERVKKLAVAAYRKIMALDFPDVSQYPKDLDGIMQFEEDLMEGRI